MDNGIVQFWKNRRVPLIGGRWKMAVAPQWIPDGFAQESISVEPNGVWLAFFAEYVNEHDEILIINYSSYASEPSAYYEKTGSLLESFETAGYKFDMIENFDNYSVAWFTPHFECCVSAPKKALEPSCVKNIVLSMK